MPDFTQWVNGFVSRLGFQVVRGGPHLHAMLPLGHVNRTAYVLEMAEVSV